MSGWFGKLMQKGHTTSRHALAEADLSKNAELEKAFAGRDAGYDAVVQMLRDREPEDREEREKRQRWYKQHLTTDMAVGSADTSASSRVRLHRVATKVPCRATPEARALLEKLKKRFPGFTVTFPPVSAGRQPVIITGGPGTTPKQIGWMEQRVEADPKLCNVRHQGLTAEVEGGSTLVLRFHHPRTAVTVSSTRDAEEPTRDEVARVSFAELRPALEPRPPEKVASPRLVWLTKPEVATMNALQSRDYEAFYTRFKLEVMAGIWSALAGSLSSAPGSQWHGGAHYTVVREPDATRFRIHQRTVDDSGRAVDIGSDRIFDAAPATDILLLYLEGDILADCADIYFTLQSLGSADAYFLKEELFTIIRRRWASSRSLSSRYGGDVAAVVRMSQRALPMPAQAVLLRQDWINLRQSLVDRYGKGGRKAADLVGHEVYRPRAGGAWPFASFPTGEVNLGLRIVYRQEWRHLGAERGEVVHTIPPDATILEGYASGGQRLEEVVEEALDGTVEAMKWPLDFDGSVSTGARGLGARTDLGLEAECRETSRDTSARVSDIMLRMASRTRDAAPAAPGTDRGEDPDSPTSMDFESPGAADVVTRVYSRLQHRYEVLTRPAEIQNVILVAEKLPTPAEIDVAWIRRHDWILSRALLDDSFRDTLDALDKEPRSESRVDVELDAKRARLCEHVRANILHYQRAIWRQEDPQQRRLRYRKSGRKVPLDWRFELASGGALTIEELGDRLAAPDVDGQFAAYAGGREADLDQVIDPAGPIGYYGNYAVYRMRPELGGDDLFSILHFFKSPYLRPNPETGEPEVDDPTSIQIGGDPAVAADVFRRERVRRITIDSGALVMDVVRSAEPAAAEQAPSDGRVDGIQAPTGCELILESAPRLDVLSTQVTPDAKTEWALVGRDGARKRSLVVRAGATAPETGDGAVVARSVENGVPALHTGRTRDPGAEPMVLVGGDTDGASTLTAIAGAGAPHGDRAVALAEGDEQRMPMLRAGRAHDPEDERGIHARGDTDGERVAIVAAGRGHDLQVTQVSPREDGAPGLTAVREAAAPSAQPAILLATDAERTPTLFAGRAHEPESEPLMHARAEGEGPRLSAVAGGRAAHARERMILAEGDEGRTTLRAGAGAGRAHERVILARYDDWLRPSLVAG